MKKFLVFAVSIALLLWPTSAVPQCIVPPNGAVVKTTSYTALAADTGKHIVMNCSSACTLTLPSTPQSPVWAIYVSSIGATAAQVSPNGLTLDGSSSSITMAGGLATGFWIDTDNTNYFSARGFVSANVRIRDIGTSWGDTTGSALTSGSVVYMTVPFACTISAWNISVDGGTATIDIWKIATGTAIPTVTNTITASALPAIASGTSVHSTTLTGWTTAVAANDIFGFQLKTVATAKYVSIDVECDQ